MLLFLFSPFSILRKIFFTKIKVKIKKKNNQDVQDDVLASVF